MTIIGSSQFINLIHVSRIDLEGKRKVVKFRSLEEILKKIRYWIKLSTKREHTIIILTKCDHYEEIKDEIPMNKRKDKELEEIIKQLHKIHPNIPIINDGKYEEVFETK